MTVFAIMAAAILGLPNPMVAMREGNVLRSFRINGVPALAVIAMPVISVTAHLLIVACFIILTAKPVFDAPLPVSTGVFLILSLLSILTMAFTGMLMGHSSECQGCRAFDSTDFSSFGDARRPHGPIGTTTVRF